MKKIGIIGGTFNPVHIGHLILAEGAYEEYHLDTVMFLPNKLPPHKKNMKIVEEYHRVNMIKLAIQKNPHFSFSDAELKRTGFSYTSDTLQYFTQRNPNSQYYFIVGADSLNYMEEWHEPEVIFQKATILAAPRGFVDTLQIDAKIRSLHSHYHADIQKLHQPNIEISSNWIRQLKQANQSIRYYVPQEVEEYIEEHHLYQM